MTATGFKMCIDCVNKQFIDFDSDGRARYYCALVDGIVLKGIVYDSTDATDCIKYGVFKPANNTTNK